MGKWTESNIELDKGEQNKKGMLFIQAQGNISSYRALRAILMSREQNQVIIKDQKSATKFAQHALELAEEMAHKILHIEHNFVRPHWLLEAAYRLDDQLDLAEEHLSEALRRDRTINLVADEANILLDLARLRYDQEKYEEALLITERCGYVLQGADVNLFLAQCALEQEKDKVKAKEYAEAAKKLAICDGPPYYYKVAYEEAERMLEKL